jgi:hypothetical protein
MVVEANRELTPQSCSPLFCHQVYHHPPSSICAHPTTRPPSPRMPANSFWGGTAGA